MPQELQVLQCYSCKTFQVHIVKKEAKWSCKLCGEKQSIKKIFYRGSGKDCRLYVQELNEKRIKSENETHSKPENNTFEVIEIESENTYLNKAESKWFEFMENVENTNVVDYGGLPKGDKYKLDSEDSRPGRNSVSKWAQFFTSENNIEDEGHGKEVRKLDNSDEESKWDESNENENITKNENLSKGLSNKKYKRVKLGEPEYHSNTSKLNPNIFDFETYSNIDSFLEM